MWSIIPKPDTVFYKINLSLRFKFTQQSKKAICALLITCNLLPFAFTAVCVRNVFRTCSFESVFCKCSRACYPDETDLEGVLSGYALFIQNTSQHVLNLLHLNTFCKSWSVGNSCGNKQMCTQI